MAKKAKSISLEQLLRICAKEAKARAGSARKARKARRKTTGRTCKAGDLNSMFPEL